MGRDESVGSGPWRAYVLALILMSGAAGVVALMAVSALSAWDGRCRAWRWSVRRFLLRTIGPRLARFVDRELFVGLARVRCRLSGQLFQRSPRLSGFAYRHFNLAVLFLLVSAAGAVTLLCVTLM